MLLDSDWLKNNTIRFKKKILKQIIFGLRISETNRKIITDIVNRNYIDKGFNVSFLQCYESATNYTIEIR
ncbi:hypothetical protein DLM78_21535 [Leptospira stimsonii]|uniref:Uncharacterized protein n=1 Tax=Leptospira stimsonii TaxID=2202203 RepID=A0A8B3CJ69_9LEPT|nr:hypothetical protein DLM78_21535 [Leptospira stimsonii]